MNNRIFYFFNHFAGRFDWFDDSVELFAQGIVWFMLAVMAYLWLTGKERNQKLVFYSLLTASVALMLGIFMISPLVNHSRPFVDHQIMQLIPHVPDASFPSDHATLAFSLAFSILFVKRKLGIVMLALAILTGISRVYVGVHYPGDILGAAALSFIISYGVYKRSSRLEVIPLSMIKMYRKLMK
ncbi:undecaprenyl-diphosphatase [Paenibacillus sp. FJAT-27812]|uniref:undecaprenyl-diphosphatase n=1 Tax=Paenibacillus sp. FJAT-27812 TaxID=1684143 RepID=UPI0006A7F216|nr:undecaprenyl-diphosphatase [Paenibacillus sp. FJAT-27812]